MMNVKLKIVNPEFLRSGYLKKQSQFRKGKMNTKLVNKRVYEENRCFGSKKNKANSKPIKANFNIPPIIKGVEVRKGVSDKAQLLALGVFSANIKPGVRL